MDLKEKLQKIIDVLEIDGEVNDDIDENYRPGIYFNDGNGFVLAEDAVIRPSMIRLYRRLLENVGEWALENYGYQEWELLDSEDRVGIILQYVVAPIEECNKSLVEE